MPAKELVFLKHKGKKLAKKFLFFITQQFSMIIIKNITVFTLLVYIFYINNFDIFPWMYLCISCIRLRSYKGPKYF